MKVKFSEISSDSTLLGGGGLFKLKQACKLIRASYAQQTVWGLTGFLARNHCVSGEDWAWKTEFDLFLSQFWRFYLCILWVYFVNLFDFYLLFYVLKMYNAIQVIILRFICVSCDLVDLCYCFVYSPAQTCNYVKIKSI